MIRSTAHSASTEYGMEALWEFGSRLAEESHGV